ncbi:MAG: ABC transporter permease [Desulfobacterales bacterium]|jgi:putative spermidine/putrescine transport system permease protein
MTGLVNSIKVASLTSILSSVLAIPAALTLSRQKIKGANMIYSFFISPLIIPVIIVAVAVFFHFSRMELIGNLYALVLAHSILAVPIVLVTTSASLQVVDRNLEYAAMSLGANPLVTFFKVTFPLIRPGVISGALFAFIISFDEVVIATFLSTYRSLTLPKHMWSAIREEIDPTIAACSCLLILTAILLIATVTILNRRAERLRR